MAPYDAGVGLIGRLSVLVSLSTVVACAASAPEAVVPEEPKRYLGLAYKPGPCVAGANVVPAAVSVLGPNQTERGLEPTDGELQFALVRADRTESPIDFRWLEVPEAAARTPLPALPWNLELSFNSAQAGTCLIRVQFRPSAQAVSMGMVEGGTTLVLTEPPPPPPLAGDAATPGNQ
jgi:hypothetical protein